MLAGRPLGYPVVFSLDLGEDRWPTVLAWVQEARFLDSTSLQLDSSGMLAESESNTTASAHVSLPVVQANAHPDDRQGQLYQVANDTV
mmetsp:Transcript_16737/g.28717  ORF Transcript_16737/g.28717 Transcript_16737/m.28717 type:complete len:88 (-) Transcript_16737:28-291(-)